MKLKVKSYATVTFGGHGLQLELSGYLYFDSHKMLTFEAVPALVPLSFKNLLSFNDNNKETHENS